MRRRGRSGDERSRAAGAKKTNARSARPGCRDASVARACNRAGERGAVSVRLGCGVLGLVLLAGCATPYADGRVALQVGRYADAARHFEDALARDPDRLDALIGLGIPPYNEGKLAEAVADLSRVVARQPSSETAHPYLPPAYLPGRQVPDA